MSTLVFFASGYPVYYARDQSPRCPFHRQRGCDEEEVSAMTYRDRNGTGDPQNPRQAWWPRSADFRAEANKHSRSPVGVASALAVTGAIQRNRDLTSVLVFAHGWGGELQFGSGQTLSNADIIRLPNVSANFAAGGNLDLYACNVGLSETFMQNLANRLGVKVRGFNQGVSWNLHWEGDAPHRRITTRGIDGQLPRLNVTKSPA